MIGALATGLVTALAHAPGVRGAMSSLNDVMYDTYYRARAPESQADAPIVVVAVDDQSLTTFDERGIGWPWPRAFWGRLIGFCNAHGAKAVVGLLLTGAKPTNDNKFKIKLVERTLGAVLAEAKEAKAQNS